MNNELHSQLVAACERFVVLNKFDAAIARLNELKREIIASYEYEKKKGVSTGKSIAKILVPSIIICTLLITFLLFTFTFIVVDKNTAAGTTADVLDFLFILSPFILVSIPFLLVFIYKKTVVQRKEKQRKQELDKFTQTIFIPQRDKVGAAISQLEREKRIFLNNTKDILDFMPEHYRTNLAVAYLERVVRTGRADTLKEGLNLFEEQLHRWQMEGYAKQMQEERALESAMINEQLSRIASNQGKIATTLQNLENLEFYNTFCR